MQCKLLVKLWSYSKQASNRSKLTVETLSSFIALVNSFRNMPFLCVLFLLSSEEAPVFISSDFTRRFTLVYNITKTITMDITFWSLATLWKSLDSTQTKKCLISEIKKHSMRVYVWFSPVSVVLKLSTLIGGLFLHRTIFLLKQGNLVNRK